MIKKKHKKLINERWQEKQSKNCKQHPFFKNTFFVFVIEKNVRATKEINKRKLFIKIKLNK